jgi:transcriptional regulator with XRE-family HTH domain
MTDARLTDPEIRRVFEEELLVGEATGTVAALVEALGLTQRELAERLGVSEGRVSQILSGGTNLTLRSLAGLGWALGVEFKLHPQAMRDRRGTPATDDAPVPGWLHELTDGAAGGDRARPPAGGSLRAPR